jgi:Cys-tRNA(Pro) deacylase
MIATKYPMTPAIRTLKDHGVPFVIHAYVYEDHGGTALAAREMGVDEHRVVKTLVMETETKAPFIVVMHGDREVSTKAMARHLGVKSVSPCSPNIAAKHTGYLVGGTSPFGARKPLKVYVESTVMDLPAIYINAGKRGLLAEIAPADLARILNPDLVSAAV